MKDEVAARKPIDFTNKDYDTYEQLAEALFKREGIENPGKRRMQARIEDLKKTNPDIKDGELKGKEITANVSEELYNKTTEEKQIAEEFNKTLQTREEADSIAQRFYQIADDNAGMNSMNKMQKLLDEEVTPDNILHVLDAYDKHKHGDSSIIDTVTSEVGAGGTKAQRKVLNTIMDKLAKAAENAGVSAGDIEKAKTDFTNSMDKEFNAVMRRTNPKDMEKAIDFLRGAIVAKQTGNIQDMTDAEAIAAFNADFAATDAEAQKAYKDAREDEGWTARAGDTVLGWFGCTTIEDMDTKLGKNAADVKRLAAAAGDEAEFKKVYKEVFGVEFDKNKIAARDAALGNYQQAQNLSSTINITSGLLEKSGTMDYSALRSEIKDKFQFDDATIDAAIENYAGLLNKDISSDAGKKEVLVRFLEETHNQATAGYREVTKGKSVEQMGKDLDLLTKSAFGTNDIVKDVMQFNENQKTTEMVTEAAFEIAGTIALQFIPGLGQVAAARLAVSAARWGTKAVKVANYAEKAFAATKNLQNLNKATKIGTQMVNAGAATMAVDLSNGKSVREATEKALMNMSFAGVGAGSSILAPKLMQTFGITNRALANEIAEEIMNAAGSYGITKLSGGEYGSQDAFIDFTSGLIIARLSHIKTPAAKDVPDTPETQPRDNTPADGTPDAPDTPETQPRDNTPADGTPVLDKAASKGKATPSSVKVGDKKAEKIKDEVNEAASNPDISGEDLAHIRNEAGGIENRDVRRDAEHKIDNAAENLSPEERAAFDAANRANAQKNVDHIFEKHSELNSADTRVMNDYINNTDDASVLRELKEKLNEKEHTYGGVTANYDRLRKAIDDKIAALEPAPVKPNTQQHDDVVAMLNEKAKTGKGLSESDFTQLKEYLATINDEAQLKELKGLLGGKKMTSAQKKQLKEALAAKTEELKNTPAPAPEAEPVETPAAERVNDAPASSPAETPNAKPDKAEVAGEDVVVTPEPVKDTPAAPVHNEPDPIVKPAETPDAEPVNDTPEAPASKPADAPATPPQNEPKHIWGEVSDDNVNPTPEPVKQADTPIVEKNEFRYPTPEEKFAMGQIGNNIGRAKTLDDLDKAQAWLDKMPDCDQKSRLAAQLDAKRQQLTADNNVDAFLDYSKAQPGTKLPKDSPVLLTGNETLRLANYDLDLSSPQIKSRLDAMQEGDVITVGREGDIKIDSAYSGVSRKHLTIEKTADGFIVKDTSRNGTSIGQKSQISEAVSYRTSIEQSQKFNQTHRIDVGEVVMDGYKDGGRGLRFDSNGNPINRPTREIIVLDRQKDTKLQSIISDVKKKTARMSDKEKAAFLQKYIHNLTGDGSAAVNNSKSWDRTHIGQEVLLGDIVTNNPPVAVCRHRSLLFKVLGDEVGLNIELQRGNFNDEWGGGGHAWNTVRFKDGTSAIYDAMHNKTSSTTPGRVDNYARKYYTVLDEPLYTNGLPPLQRRTQLPEINENELVRTAGNNGKPVPELYVKTSREARAYLNQAIESGSYTESLESYIQTINRMHVISAFGESGKDFWYGEHGGGQLDINAGHIRDEGVLRNHRIDSAIEVEDIARQYGDSYRVDRSSKVKLPGIPDSFQPSDIQGGYHFYPDGVSLKPYYYKEMHRTAKEALKLIDKGASEKEILEKIAEHYQYAANARPYGQINNSLFMNEINTLLTKAGMRTIPHGILDIASMHLQPKYFKRYFIDQYYQTALPSAR